MSNNNVFRATFIFKDNKLEVTAKGSEFNEFKSQFKPDDRGFGYIKIMVSVHTKYQAILKYY